MKAGFAESDISPAQFPVRTYLGQVDAVRDPIHAHAAVFDDGKQVFAIVSLDVVIVEAAYAKRIRRLVAEAHGIPESRILVCATHNHACPAVVDRPTCLKEPAYIERMLGQAVQAVSAAFARRAEVEIGAASGVESRVSFNRRFIKRDGTVVSEPENARELADILCNEGVIDPEVGVLAARNRQGRVVGALVNFGCHACHFIGEVSAGYPGIMERGLRESYGGEFVGVFLNGPCGNVIHQNFLDPTVDTSMETVGELLAQKVRWIVETITFLPNQTLSSAEAVVQIAYRPLSELEGKLARPETLINVLEVVRKRGWYAYSLERLRELHARAGGEEAIVQAVRIGDSVFASVPAEYFMEHGLRIKRGSPLRKTYVVSLANGWLGYIPTRDAFTRDGGHESTQALWSKMEPRAGDILADQALALIRQVTKS